MKLYEIATAYWQALDFLTDPEQDIPLEAVNDTIEALEGDFDQKAVNIAAFARQMELEAEASRRLKMQWINAAAHWRTVQSGYASM